MDRKLLVTMLLSVGTLFAFRYFFWQPDDALQEGVIHEQVQKGFRVPTVDELRAGTFAREVDFVDQKISIEEFEVYRDTIYASEYPGRDYKKIGDKIIQDRYEIKMREWSRGDEEFHNTQQGAVNHNIHNK